MARRNRRRGCSGPGDLSRQRRDRRGKAAGRVIGHAGRRPRLHLRPALQHGVQRRVPRLGRRRRPARTRTTRSTCRRRSTAGRSSSSTGSSSSPNKKAMTDLAKFATVSDHYFHRLPEQRTNANYSFDPNYRWDSDDAEVTIPGATCPGQRVLLAAHPDGTPVTPDDRRRGEQPDRARRAPSTASAPGGGTSRSATSRTAARTTTRRASR